MQILANIAGLLWVAGVIFFGALSLLAIILVLGAVVMGNRREFVFAETVEENGTIPEIQSAETINPVAQRSPSASPIEPAPHGHKPIPAGA